MKKELVKTGNGFDKLVGLDFQTVTPEDQEGYPESDYSIVTYSGIRQKAKTDDDGNIIQEPGGFKISNEIIGEVPDPSGLLITIVTDMLNAQQRWPNEMDKPDCISYDGKLGSKHGQCSMCPYYRSGEKDGCKSSPILFGIEDTFGTIVVRLSASAVKPLNIFYKKLAAFAKEQSKGKVSMIPPHFFITKIGTQFKKEPQPHYTPTFDIVGQNDAETLELVRKERENIMKVKQAVAAMSVDNDD